MHWNFKEKESINIPEPATTKSAQNGGRVQLTTSQEIRELESLLLQKKEQKSQLELKYRPLVDQVVLSAVKESLEPKILLQLLEERFALEVEKK